MNTRKDHLLDTAQRLFNANGYHATGIDRILSESGVSKATLYKYFRSKEALIMEVLRRRHHSFDTWLREFVDARSSSKYRGEPAGAMLAVFDGLDRWFRSENFCGCNFINASAEYGDRDDPIHELVKQHKSDLRDYLKSLLKRGGFSRARELSQQLMLLVDGAIVNAHTQNNPKAAREARQAAKCLLSAAAR